MNPQYAYELQQKLPGTGYSRMLLDLWEQTTAWAVKFRYNFLMGRKDPETISRLVALLSQMWLELYPKLQGSTDHNDLDKKMKEFEKFHDNPILFLKHPTKILELLRLIRQALEAAGLTQEEKLEEV